jgi:hypothetical protein
MVHFDYSRHNLGKVNRVPGDSNTRRKIKPMGDKSPKSVNKQTTQKKAKAAATQNKKAQVAAAKRAPKTSK